MLESRAGNREFIWSGLSTENASKMYNVYLSQNTVEVSVFNMLVCLTLVPLLFSVISIPML